VLIPVQEMVVGAAALVTFMDGFCR